MLDCFNCGPLAVAELGVLVVQPYRMLTSRECDVFLHRGHSEWFWYMCVGQDPAAPSPTEAATNTKHTSDLLRRFKEMTVKEPKDLASLDQSEIDLRVGSPIMGQLSHCKYHSKICPATCCCMNKSFHVCVYVQVIKVSAYVSSFLAMSRVSVLYLAEAPQQP